jgi:hypothetical protein
MVILLLFRPVGAIHLNGFGWTGFLYAPRIYRQSSLFCWRQAKTCPTAKAISAGEKRRRIERGAMMKAQAPDRQSARRDATTIGAAQ